MMNSTRCPQCGFVSWAGGQSCKSCGGLLTPFATNQRQGYENAQPRDRRAFNGELKKSLAVWSLVLGITSCLTFGLFGIGSTVGLTLAIIAIVRVNRYPFEYGGKRIAVAGLITSVLSMTVMPIGIIAAIAIPNLLAARRAANEAASIRVLRTVYLAEAQYQSLHGGYGTLDQLAAEKLITQELASGSRFGYKFRLEMSPGETERASGFEVNGIPSDYPSSGRRSFFIDESGVIRAADSHGAEATKSDPPLNFDDEYSPRRSTSRSYASEPVD